MTVSFKKLFLNETALIVGVIYRAPGSSRDFFGKLDGPRKL